MNDQTEASSNRCGRHAYDTTHHSPNTSIQGAPHARTEREGPFNGSETLSQHTSDEEYENPEQLESTWLSRAHSRVEELRRLFNLPPSEVKPSAPVLQKILSQLHPANLTSISPVVWPTSHEWCVQSSMWMFEQA